MFRKEIGWKAVDGIGLAQERDKWRTVVSMVMNAQLPYNIENFLSSWGTDSFSGRTLLWADSNDSNDPATDQHGL